MYVLLNIETIHPAILLHPGKTNGWNAKNMDALKIFGSSSFGKKRVQLSFATLFQGCRSGAFLHWHTGAFLKRWSGKTWKT